jgi:hypothetical protein
MPFKSEKQRRLFQMIAHGKHPTKYGRSIGPSPEVARKFIADSGNEVSKGKKK